MSIHPRRFLLSLACALVLVAVLVASLVSSPVSAGGAQPALPGGSSIQPGEETPIQMASEVVTFNIRQATEADNNLVLLATERYGFQKQPVWFPAVAEIEAEFTLKNPTSQEINLTVWYPMASVLNIVDWNLSPEDRIPRIQEFEAYIDGNPSNAMVSDLPNPKGADKPDLPWANFPVTFPAGKVTVIDIKTKLPLQPSISGIEMTLYNVFHTGAGWAGPIGQAELILNLPYPASPETLAGIPTGTLRVPPYCRPSERADLPAGVVLEGNQAHWTWKNMEPDPQDDFALWLLQPGQWQVLETARKAVLANQNDGQARLALGSVYYSFSSSGPGYPTVFASSFLPQGIASFQKAADLLPDRSAPHAGMGLLTLEEYMAEKNAPQETILSILDEFQTAKELEAMNPTIAKETGRTRWLLMSLQTELESYYFPDEATATAVWAAWRTHWLETHPGAVFLETTSATPTTMTTPTGTPTWEPTFTSIPSSTSQPFTTPSLTAASLEPVERGTWMMTGSGLVAIAILVAVMLVLIIAGYLVYHRSRKRTEK